MTKTTTKTPNAKTTAKKKGEPRTEPDKLSAIDAAAKILGEKKEPLNCKEMIEAMAAKGYWTSPGGKTPHATLYTVVTMLPKCPPFGGFNKRAG